jgi:hypothetical protein
LKKLSDGSLVDWRSEKENDLQCDSYQDQEASVREKIIPIVNSKKPLWIDEVKKTCEEILPQIDMKDLEMTKDILAREDGEDMFISMEEYPYYQTIKKLNYAFGDTFKNSQRTVIYSHDFLKRFLVTLGKILYECDFKKTIEHLYSYEYSKFYNYKKLKFKNTFDENEGGEEKKENLLEGDLLSFEDGLNEVLDIDEMEIDNIDNNENQEMQGDDHQNLIQESEINHSSSHLAPLSNFMPQMTQHSANKNFSLSTMPKNYNSKNYLESIFEDKDENYFENLAFQDQRTSSMSQIEYMEFISCRHQTFLTKGKKTFLNYLQNILGNYFPNELKDFNNLELISFLCKEILRKIMTEAIRNKHPGGERKLFVLNFPILVEDIEDLCSAEMEKLETFTQDYNSDIYLMKELKKKKSSKDNNRNVKIKKSENEVLVIIKKIIFLEDETQIEFLRKNKKKSEEKVTFCLGRLAEKYQDILKSLKLFFENKNDEENNMTTRGKKSSRKKMKKEQNGESYPLQETFNLEDFLINNLGIKNYYEYFLIQNFLIPNLEDKLNPTQVKEMDNSDYKSLKDEINSKLALIKKTNKKILWAKFKIWLKMSNNERNFIIDEFNKITKLENNFYQNDEESSLSK